MANVLPKDKQIAVIAGLAEGSSLRALTRITGIHRTTIMNLALRVGNGCARLLDEKMRDLTCHYLEFDEIWGFIGKRNSTANAFVSDVASRLKNRPQISSDGLRAYVEAVENAFGMNIDFGMIIKNYGADKGEHHQERRYSAPEVTSMQKIEIMGRPDPDLISTSHIERIRQSCQPSHVKAGSPV